MTDAPADAGSAKRCRALAGRADRNETRVVMRIPLPGGGATGSGRRCRSAGGRPCLVRGVVRPGRGRHRGSAGGGRVPQSERSPSGRPSTPRAHPGRMRRSPNPSGSGRRTGGVDGRKIGRKNRSVKEKNKIIGIFSLLLFCRSRARQGRRVVRRFHPHLRWRSVESQFDFPITTLRKPGRLRGQHLDGPPIFLPRS